MTTSLAPLDHAARQLLTRIDVALELGEGTPEESVALAWRSAVHDQPELVGLLGESEFHAGSDAGSHAAVAARRRLLSSVAVAAGLATFDDPVPRSAAVGELFLAAVEAARPTGVRRGSRVQRALHRLWFGAEPDPWPWAA